MKIKELIYQTPEMSEEKLLKIMDSHINWIKKDVAQRINSFYKEDTLSQAMLHEYDKIQDKKSYLTKSQRDIVVGFVGVCMIEMTKGKDGQSTK